MGFTCAIAECQNTEKVKKERGDSLVYHRFPVKSPGICKVWITKCHRKETINPSTAYICSDHFIPGDYEDDMMNRIMGLPEKKKLKNDAIPSLFPTRNTWEASRSLGSDSRKARALRNDRRKVVSACIGEPDCGQDNPDDCASLTDEQEQIQMLREKLKDKELDNLHLIRSNIRQSNEIICLKSQNQVLKNKLRCNSSARFSSKCKKRIEVFSQAQLKKLGGQRRVNWSKEDIVKALTVRSVSLKGYNTAISTWKLPLPAVRTLQSWIHTFSCEPGFLEDVFRIMSESSKTMDLFNKICVLSFDEMSIDSAFVLDPTQGSVLSHSKVQVILARGICGSWKQPIYFNYDTDVTKLIVDEAILKLETAGYPTHAIVSDLVTTNQGLWKQLGISDYHTYFANPFDKERSVHVFGDIPHCLKNLRNHLLDSPLFFSDGTVLTKDMLEQLIQLSGSELKLCPKLTQRHLELIGAERMRVRPAAQLLSAHTAALASLKYENLPAISTFFQVVNDGFDVLNSRVITDATNKMRSGFSSANRQQVSALDKLLELIQDIRFMRIGKKAKKCISPSLLPFQKGFVMSIKSLHQLSSDLFRLYNVKYLLQD